MAEITTYTMENKLGCGLTRGAFLSRLFWPRKTSVHSLPAESSTNITSLPSIDSNSKKPPIHNSKGNRTSPSLASFIPPIFPSLRQKLGKNGIVWFLQGPRLLLKINKAVDPQMLQEAQHHPHQAQGGLKYFKPTGLS
jgi:hypothetical protein